MKISFESTRLEKDCSVQKKALRKWGPDNGKRVMRRLDELKAAPDLEAMRNLPGRCHELKADRKGQLCVDVKHPLRLIFRPTGSDFKSKEDGGLDWTSVKEVEIMEVTDTHE